MTSLPGVCDVALPIPAAEPYSYAIPPALADRVRPGVRVVVPVRGREVIGIVVAVRAPGDAPEVTLKPILLAPDAAPLVTPALLDLGEWVSRYYVAPIGLTLKSMVPAGLWGASQLRVTLTNAQAATGTVGKALVAALTSMRGRASARALARKLRRPVWDALQRAARTGAVSLETMVPDRAGVATERVVRLRESLPSLLEREATFGRAHRQRQAFEALDELGGEAALSRLTGDLGFSRSVISGLESRGLATVEDRERVRDPFAGVSSPPPPDLTTDQRTALAAIDDLPAGGAAVLFGVTGSGKTLVYLRAIERLVRAGRGAIVLVPEISLTPQTVARVRGMFGDDVAVLHSGLSDGERSDAWRLLATGRRRVVVGARSAVFAPVRDLAAIVIDEEHDASYKNGETPRYHARDVARRRARLEGARVILGSATPSLEVWAARDTLPVIRLPTRASAQPMPPVELVDLRSSPMVDGAGPVPWTERLDAAVADRLARRQQVLLLLNRRGFAHYLQCGECGEVVHCPACSIALTVHRTPARLRCHYCGFDRSVPERCEACGGPTQRTRGVGTQTLERWVTHRFPEARLARMDADTTGSKWSHRQILDEVAAGSVDVLLGTQMIAKGLDFPNVTLVGVVNADTGLHLPDFRAAERTFQLIAQVAGRAGRGPAGGTVLVQTRAPDHDALVSAAAHDFEGFAGRELLVREDPPYPPTVSLVNVVVSGEQEDRVSRAADRLATWVRGLLAARDLEAWVLGPAPAPLARIKRRWRWHFVLRAPDPRTVGRVVRYAVAHGPVPASGGVRAVFDRDPVSLL